MKNWMEESSFYQMLLAEGEVKGCRAILLRQGRKIFGPPSPAVEATLNVIKDMARLDTLVDRLLDVSSWDEFLRTP